MTSKTFNFNSEWALFLDRDGVINRQLKNDYVKKWEEFEFLPGALEAIAIFTKIFGKIFVVTNQQGIGKGLMTEIDLTQIHDRMIEEVRYEGGRINKVYHSPFTEDERSVFRKPAPGMARKAKIDFPEIEFEKSVMIGDSLVDMEFGKNLGMITIYIRTKDRVTDVDVEIKHLSDLIFPDLITAARYLSENN